MRINIEVKEVEVYSIDDVKNDKELLEKVINKHRDINVNFDWWDFIYEDFKEHNDEYFDIDKIYFSGFWSQGDGAMFEYSSISDRLKDIFIDGLDLSPMRKGWLRNNVSVSGKGVQRGLYYHEKSCSHSIYWEVDNGDLYWDRPLYQWIESFANDFENFVEELYSNLCCDLYSTLEKEYTHLTSDESILESLESNQYEFTEDGNIY
jgi:hypothetical protein